MDESGMSPGNPFALAAEEDGENDMFRANQSEKFLGGSAKKRRTQTKQKDKVKSKSVASVDGKP